MLLPIRTSIRPWRRPYANYVLIAINIIAFVMQNHPSTALWINKLMLTAARPQLWQFVTYAFLHSNLMHIIGNMFFLYLFGNNVNDKFGHTGYVCFYLAGAVFAGIGHSLVSINPVIGASGAVAAVTGAYLVLFPQTVITVIYWFLFIGTMDISALYFIAFKMIIFDNIIAGTTANVAYDAHLAGYAFGITATVLLLASGLIHSDGLNLWSMIKQWNRRRRYRSTVSGGYDPFADQMRKPVQSKEVDIKTTTQTQADERTRQLREEIGRRITEHNLSEAASLYLGLMQTNPEQVLAQQYLLDIANQLASEGKYDHAGRAYEKFLAHYGNYQYIEQVQLMLGIIYSRYLNEKDPAIKHLTAALDKLSAGEQLNMCRDELDKLRKQ